MTVVKTMSNWFALSVSLADFSTLKMEVILPPKRRFTQDLHGATSQKTAFFIVTAVKTKNLTQSRYLSCLFPHQLIHNLLFPLQHRAFVSLQFLNIYAVGRTPWMGDQPVARPLPAQDDTNTE
jgi:hypothetical protein